ncbi:MAG: ATP-dependent Clp protease adaptor ClpS [Bacteroidia bacterium]|nr:ATP-dependent Clp protease adaptor ClpS [Bacteroidia bacterium]MDW8157709.1 ATP-dependent Clp protease adaptor ClpS [Bacteroidia bacterium]
MIKELTIIKEDNKITDQELYRLVLYNDDVNTFDWVIQCLVEVCHHTPEQAEQCAWIVHTKGKYAVLGGTREFLEPRCEALGERGLTVAIE